MNYLNLFLFFIVAAIVLSGCSLLFGTPETETQSTTTVTPDAILKKDTNDSLDLVTSTDQEPVMKKEEPLMEKEEVTTNDVMEKTEQITFTGAVLAGNSSLLLDFNQQDYEKALKANENVVLYFYANWCPLCKNEVKNGLYPAFNELADPSVIGFRVNFNDGDTDSDEKALAKKFGIAYQHTKVFLKNGNRVLKDPSTWNKMKYKDEINKLTN
jgi:thiol-disulfide isomerase/thioredoxin